LSSNRTLSPIWPVPIFRAATESTTASTPPSLNTAVSQLASIACGERMFGLLKRSR
jgi:hypothetical protein